MDGHFVPYSPLRTSAAVVALTSMRTFADAIWLYTLELNTPNAYNNAVVRHARQRHHSVDADDILSFRPSSECH